MFSHLGKCSMEPLKIHCQIEIAATYCSPRLGMVRHVIVTYYIIYNGLWFRPVTPDTQKSAFFSRISRGILIINGRKLKKILTDS